MSPKARALLVAVGASGGALLGIIPWLLPPDSPASGPRPVEAAPLLLPAPPAQKPPSELTEPPFDPATILEPYDGKYAGDAAFHERALQLARAVPGAVEQIRAQLRLGCVEAPRIRIRLLDAGEHYPGFLARATVEDLDGRKVQVITVVAEDLATDSFSIPGLVLHESAHCWQHQLLGRGLNGIPVWLVEGLADWVALEGEEYGIRMFCSSTFDSSEDIRTLLDRWHEEFLGGKAKSTSSYAYYQLAVRFLRLLDPPGDGDAFLHRLFVGEGRRGWKEELLRSTGLTFPEFAARLRPWAEARVLAFLKNRGEFLTALALKEREEWKAATEAFDAFASLHPMDALTPLSRYEAAACTFRAGQYTDSLYRLDTLEKEWPHTTLGGNVACLRFWNVFAMADEIPEARARALTLGEAYLKDHSYRETDHLDGIRKKVERLRR